MSELPVGWEVVKLKDIAKIKSGATPLRAKKDLYYSESGVPWIKTLDLNNSEIVVTDERITELALQETSCSIFPIDTVLVAMYGGFNQIGRTGLITTPSAINQALSGLILDQKKTVPIYVLNYLNANVSKWKKFAASSRKDPNITRQDVCSFSILLPPLPEQRKIAQILSTWDKAIATTEKRIANSKQQKKALMQQLLTGKRRLAGFSGDWKSDKLKNIVGKIYGGGTPSRQNPEFWGGGIPWITVKDLISEQISKSQEYISQAGLQESSSNMVPSGTVIIATRMAVGKAVTATCDVAINQDLKAVSSSENICSEYLLYWFLFNSRKIEKMGTGSTVKGIQIETIKSLPMFVPKDIEEQQKIAQVLTTADKEISTLETQLSHLQQEKKALMQQLLTGKRRVVVEEG